MFLSRHAVFFLSGVLFFYVSAAQAQPLHLSASNLQADHVGPFTPKTSPAQAMSLCGIASLPNRQNTADTDFRCNVLLDGQPFVFHLFFEQEKLREIWMTGKSEKPKNPQEPWKQEWLSQTKLLLNVLRATYPQRLLQKAKCSTYQNAHVENSQNPITAASMLSSLDKSDISCVWLQGIPNPTLRLGDEPGIEFDFSKAPEKLSEQRTQPSVRSSLQHTAIPLSDFTPLAFGQSKQEVQKILPSLQAFSQCSSNEKIQSIDCIMNFPRGTSFASLEFEEGRLFRITVFVQTDNHSLATMEAARPHVSRLLQYLQSLGPLSLETPVAGKDQKDTVTGDTIRALLGSAGKVVTVIVKPAKPIESINIRALFIKEQEHLLFPPSFKIKLIVEHKDL